MDLKKQLLVNGSKSNALLIVNYIGDNTVKYAHLMNLFMGEHFRTTQRAAHVISLCHDKNPELISPHIDALILNLKNQVHPAVKRNTLRVLQETPIPSHLTGDLVDICFQALTSSQEPVAIKVFAMTVLANASKTEPDLKNELKLIIEDQMPYSSAAYISRGRKILKKLQQQ